MHLEAQVKVVSNMRQIREQGEKFVLYCIVYIQPMYTMHTLERCNLNKRFVAVLTIAFAIWNSEYWNNGSSYKGREMYIG